jgi:hypothetical protein
MMPTADQVARAIVQAAKECDFLGILKQQPALITTQPQRGRTKTEDKLRHVKGYAALALRAAFPACGSHVIGRMVGSANPAFLVGVLVAYKAKGQLPWYDPEAEARIIAAIGACDPDPQQVVVDETEEQMPPPLPALSVKSSMGKMRRTCDGRSASKRRLEDELRQAVLNTGGRLA